MADGVDVGPRRLLGAPEPRPGPRRRARRRQGRAPVASAHLRDRDPVGVAAVERVRANVGAADQAKGKRVALVEPHLGRAVEAKAQGRRRLLVHEGAHRGTRSAVDYGQHRDVAVGVV